MDSGAILIIAAPGDVHALTVASRLKDRHSIDCFIWDSSRYPAEDNISLSLGSERRPKYILVSKAVGRVNLNKLRSIWWRRPQPSRIPEEVSPEHLKAYCRRESNQLLRGILQSLDVPIYNNPFVEQLAERKAYQLACAVSAKLSVPATLMSNAPEEVRRFFDELEGRVIYKPFGSPPVTFFGTQRLRDEAMARLEHLSSAPAIFQEEVAPHFDIRVTVVGDTIFAAEARTDALDWRLESNLIWTKHELPACISRKILRLMDIFGLDLGSLDFRLTQGGDYIFFEINPNGQFLFLEVDDRRLTLSAAFADYLAAAGAPRWRRHQGNRHAVHEIGRNRVDA